MPINGIISLLDVNFKGTARRTPLLMIAAHKLLDKEDIVCNETTRDECRLILVNQRGKMTF